MRKVRQYKYTRTTHFKDGSSVESSITRDVEPHVSPNAFKGDVLHWDRQGNSMKKVGTVTDIYGYDYWISEDQEKHNNLAYKRYPIEVN